MSDVLEYPDVLQEVRGALNPGRLKLQSNMLIFKNMKTGIVDQFPSEEVEKTYWLMRSRGHCLKVMMNNGAIHRFDGFREGEFDKLAKFVTKYYNTDLEKQDLSVKGWNWGLGRFKGDSLDFEVDGKSAFEVPLGNVSHSATTKNEVTLEFHQNDDAAVSLMELRFHIPTDPNSEEDRVQEFYKKVMAKADILKETGDSIAVFSELQCLVPRGRYDIKIFPTFLQLHGKTFDYKIPYTTILRLFLLPHRDNRQMFFVVSLDPPIKQGMTRYHFLILLFNKEDETTLELGLSEEDIQEKYDGKLMKEMSGPEYEIVSRIMKTLVNKKITVPGSFVGNTGTHSVACSYKAATGFLYPLERGFIFVHKPPIHIRFDEIASVNFARSSGSTRSFDFDVDTKAGTTYTFVGIEKDEYGKLYDFVSQKKLRVKNIGGKMDKTKGDYNDDMLGSSDEGEHDAYLERMKREAQDRDDDEDESSEDSDYNPDIAEASDVAEEYDTDAYTSSSSEDGEGSKGSGNENEDEETKQKRKEEKEKRKQERREKRVKTIREPKEGGVKRKKRRSKKDHDPDRPKRPQSAYFLWLNENRERIKEEHPGIAITEISKKAGEQWKTIEDKTKWEGLAAEAKGEYEEAMKVYKEKVASRPPLAEPAEGSDTAESPKKKKKSPKASKSPKKPVAESKAGSGAGFKSREFLSSDESSSSNDDKPLKKKSKKEKKKKESDVSEAPSSPEKPASDDSD